MKCPCCQQEMPVPDGPEFLAFIEKLPGLDRKIVQTLVDRYPQSLTMQQLVDRVYADNIDGGPLFANSAVAARLTYVRRRILDFGWTIPKCKPGPGAYGRYRLERIDAPE